MTSQLRLFGYSDLEGIYDRPAAVGELAGFLSARRDGSLVVGAGDNGAMGVGATVSYNHEAVELPTPEGRALAAPFYDAVSPDAETFGNHDFDHGPRAARQTAKRLSTAFVCANVDHPALDAEVVESTRVFDTDAGRVGVFGVTTADLPSFTPAAADVAVSDPVETARRVTAELCGRVDHVVGLSHCGATDSEVAAAADAAIVLGGHLHERHADTYGGTLLVRTGGDGVVEATADGAYTFHDGFGGDATRETTDDCDPADPCDTTEPASDVTDLAPDVTDRVRRRYERVQSALGLDEIVATVETPVPRDERALVGGESRAGNFVADAYRTETGADVGIMHNGSLRSGPPLAGDVTAREIVSLSPFGNRLTELSLTGTQLRAALRALCPTADDDRWFLSLSGGTIRWTADSQVLERVRIGGTPLRDDRRYTVATQGYLVDVDGIESFTPDRVVATHDRQYDHLIEHARNGGLAVEPDDRIRRV